MRVHGAGHRFDGLRGYAAAATFVAADILSMEAAVALTTWDIVGIWFIGMMIGLMAVGIFQIITDVTEEEEREEAIGKQERAKRRRMRNFRVMDMTTWEMINVETGEKIKW